MASETYYFAFSLVFLLGILFHLVNMTYFRLKGRTLTGNAFKPNTPEYRLSLKLSSTRNLIIYTLAALLAVANVAYSASRLVRHGEAYSRPLLVLIPALLLLCTAIVVAWLRNEYGDASNGRHDKKR